MSKPYVPGLVATLALAISGLVTTQAWSQGAAPAPKISQSLAKTFKAAQEAQAAKHWPEVIAKAQEALATSGRKPDDTYYAYVLMFEAYRAQGNTAEAGKALEGELDSGFLPPAYQVLPSKAVISIAFQAKDYDKALEFGQRLIKNGVDDPEVNTYVAQSYYLKGNYTEASKFLNNMINDQIKAGQTPRETQLQMLQASYNKLGNKSAETDVLEKLVVAYSKPLYWEQLLFAVRTNPALSDPRKKLWVYRLMWATKTLKQGSDYMRFAEYAQGAGLPAEAQQVFESGLKANAFSDEDKAKVQRQLPSLIQTVARDKAELPKLEAESRSAATGDVSVSLGMAQYSYGDTPKAIEALQRGVAQGGLKEQMAVDGAMTLGMAQQRVKDGGAAQKTFKSVKTDDPLMQRIANLWALYAQ